MTNPEPTDSATPPGPATSATPEAAPEPASAPVAHGELRETLGEIAHEVAPALAPVRARVRSDVSRMAEFLRSIHSGYLLAGLAFLVATAVAGVLITLTGGFSDWYMHLAMYVVLLAVTLLYVRAHQRRRRIRQALYAFAALVLIAFFAWILSDLVPERLDVLSARARPDGVVAPQVVTRPEAPLLWLVFGMLGVTWLWLLFHWLVVSRHRSGADVRLS